MIALIPARGGSKQVPQKNLRVLAGKPLIVHTLEQALAANGIDRVVVSTDDDAISAMAETVPGVDLPLRRPPSLATDTASAIDVYLHAAEVLEASALCVLLPTSPLRSVVDIEACLALFHSRDANTVLSVTAAKPPSWHQVIGNDGRLSDVPGIHGDVANRQQVRRTVVPNGAVYVIKIKVLKQCRTYFGNSTYGYEMPADRSIDIDTAADFRIAEALMRLPA